MVCVGVARRLPPQLSVRDRAGCEPRCPALAPRDGIDRVATAGGSTGLHFDEDERPAVSGDDVDFASSRAVAAINNCVPAPKQFVAGEIFPGFSQRAVLRDRHTPWLSKCQAARGEAACTARLN